MVEREEVLLEPAFVLHHRPFRNTSQLIDCLTARHGRIGLVANGSRRTGSGQRALLQPFSPLRVSWLRRSDLGRLTGVESDGAAIELEGNALLAGFYVNELLLRLVARGDHSDEIFSCYSTCLIDLGSGRPIARSLRLFELGFLRALGYGIGLDRDATTGEPLVPEGSYAFEFERGLTRVRVESGADVFAGKDIISLRERVLEDQPSLRSARRLLGLILDSYLGDRPLRTRAVFKEIADRGF
jgi:DNA repair protein RecO (recombination protein O)